MTAYQDTVLVVGRGLWMLKNALITSVGSHSHQPSLSLELFQNYPNPFNPKTEIRYIIAASANSQLAVYTILGERAMVLAEGVHSPGRYVVTFDGSTLSSGVYLVVLRSGNETVVKKMTLVR